MNRTLLLSMIAGLLLVEGTASAEPLSAELVMGKDRAWQGQIIRRDGDWIEFSTGTSAKPIRIGVSTIKELNFKVVVNAEKLSALIDNREFERVIDALSRALEPFAEYNDVPSNLTRYNALMMEMYYLTKQYDKSLALSAEIVADDRNPALQSKARVYRALALIDSGNVDEAKNLMTEFGWEQDVPDDATPEELYIRAKLMVLNEDYSKAMELAANVVAFHSQDPEWIQPAELLCAEIYTELGMYDSAEEVCRQILLLYQDTPEFDKAKLLKVRIEQLRADQKLEMN